MEEEDCHFVYKDLWSPMKAPCFWGWVGPRRGEERNPIQPAEREILKAEAWSKGRCCWKWWVSSEPDAACPLDTTHLPGSLLCIFSSACGLQIIQGQYKAYLGLCRVHTQLWMHQTAVRASVSCILTGKPEKYRSSTTGRGRELQDKASHEGETIQSTDSLSVPLLRSTSATKGPWFYCSWGGLSLLICTLQ